jgi:nonsense-mediated mRNA decay protein 3
VQLRQKRADSDGGSKGLLILELAIARNAELRKHILQVQTKKAGFDFYFASLDKARHFSQYLAKAAPMRMKTSQSLVSEDVKNNTANVKHTVSLDMVPLCRDDLVVVDKHAKGVGRLSGRLCLVLKISSTVHLVDASPSRASDMSSCCSDLNADNYWRGGEEKSYRLLLSSRRFVRFVVLDVEICVSNERHRYCNGDKEESDGVYAGPTSTLSKYALADVEVARESDLGVNDETFRCVTHLGNLLSVGDVVLGYDLTSSVLSGGDQWSVENAFVNSFVMPDVVIVRKAKGVGQPAETEGASKSKAKAKSSASRKKDRRQQKEEKKQRKLEAAAARMGLDTDIDVHLDEEAFDDDNELLPGSKIDLDMELDEDLAEDLETVERELRLVEIKKGSRVSAI